MFAGSVRTVILTFSLLAVGCSFKFSASGSITCTRKQEFVADIELWEDSSLALKPLSTLKVKGPGTNGTVPYTIEGEADEGAKVKIQITHMCFEDETSLGQEILSIGMVSEENAKLAPVDVNLDTSTPQELPIY